MRRIKFGEEKRHFIKHAVGTTISADSYMCVVPKQRSEFGEVLIENNESVFERNRGRRRRIIIIRRRRRRRRK
jgi:hypothetical protein